MKFLMSSCLTTTSFFSGLTARIWPVSSYCLGGGDWRHADDAITASTATAIATRSYRQPPGQPIMIQLYRMNVSGVGRGLCCVERASAAPDGGPEGRPDEPTLSHE